MSTFTLLLVLQVLRIGHAIYEHSIGYFPKNIAPGLQSIGIEPFLDEKAANYALEERDLKNHQLKLHLYPVLYQGEPLFGWFRVKVTVENGGVQWFALQAESKTLKHSTGEFFYAQFNKSDQECFTGTKYSSANSDPEKLTKFNFVPSLYAPNPSPTVPTGFAFKTTRSDPAGFPSELSFFWRMDMPLCGVYDETNPIVFRGYALKKDAASGLLTAESPEVRYRNFLYGAADPKPPKNAPLSCSKEGTPSWTDSIAPGTNLGDASSSTCTQTLKDKKVKDHFYGRCSIPHVSGQEVYECKGNNKFYAALPVQRSIERDGNRGVNLFIYNFCVGPHSVCPEIYDNLSRTGISTQTYFGSYITRARTSHGLFMIVMTFFFLPVTNFATRYLKETFLRQRVLHNHIWYFVHFVGVIHSFIAIVGALVESGRARRVYGTSGSEMAGYHRLVGWISVGIFMFLMLVNGLRITPRLPNLLGLFCHFLLGNVFYYSCIAGTVLSCYIPASPSSQTIEDTEFPLALVFIIAWVAFDIVMHAVMTLFVEWFDWQMDISGPRLYICHRWCGLMFFPVVDIDAEWDAPGRRFREYMQSAYTIVAFGVTLALCLILGGDPKKGTFLGRMELTHDDQGQLLDPDVLPPVHNLV